MEASASGSSRRGSPLDQSLCFTSDRGASVCKEAPEEWPDDDAVRNSPKHAKWSGMEPIVDHQRSARHSFETVFVTEPRERTGDLFVYEPVRRLERGNPAGQ